jgi:hypothetical protein
VHTSEPRAQKLTGRILGYKQMHVANHTIALEYKAHIERHNQRTLLVRWTNNKVLELENVCGLNGVFKEAPHF